MKIERQIDITAPAEDIYAVVTDAGRLGEWVTIHQGLLDGPEGALCKGSELTQSLKLAGRRFKVRWRVVENDRPRRVVWEGRGPMRSKAKVVYEMDENENGTRFSYTIEYALPGGPLGRMAGPVVRRVTAGELESSLENLRGLVE